MQGVDFGIEFGGTPQLPDYTGAYGHLAATTQALSRIISQTAATADAKRQRDASQAALQEAQKLISGKDAMRIEEVREAQYHPILSQIWKQSRTADDPDQAYRSEAARFFVEQHGYAPDFADEAAASTMELRPQKVWSEETIYGAVRLMQRAGMEPRAIEQQVEHLTGGGHVGLDDLRQTMEQGVSSKYGGILDRLPGSDAQTQALTALVAGMTPQERAQGPTMGTVPVRPGKMEDLLTGSEIGMSDAAMEQLMADPGNALTMNSAPLRFDYATGQIMPGEGADAETVARLNASFQELIGAAEIDRIRSAGTGSLKKTATQADKLTQERRRGIDALTPYIED